MTLLYSTAYTADGLIWSSMMELTIHWLQCLAPKICFWEEKSYWCRTGPGPSWRTRSSTTKTTTSWCKCTEGDVPCHHNDAKFGNNDRWLQYLHNLAKGKWSGVETFHPVRQERFFFNVFIYLFIFMMTQILNGVSAEYHNINEWFNQLVKFRLYLIENRTIDGVFFSGDNIKYMNLIIHL